MITNIIISSTLFLTFVLFPLLLFISSNFLLKLLQKGNQMLEFKIKEKEKQTHTKKKLQFNLFHLLRFHKSILSTTQIPIWIKIFLAKHLSSRRNLTQRFHKRKLVILIQHLLIQGIFCLFHQMEKCTSCIHTTQISTSLNNSWQILILATQTSKEWIKFTKLLARIFWLHAKLVIAILAKFS